MSFQDFYKILYLFTQNFLLLNNLSITQQIDLRSYLVKLILSEEKTFYIKPDPSKWIETPETLNYRYF